MNTLIDKFQMKLDETATNYVRRIHDEIAWNDRLVSIVGARGVGKSTVVLQHIKLHEDINTSLYVSADDLWFSQHSLVELAEMFFKNGGKALYIDEIHKYKNWAQEIKNIYDTYSRLRVVYTGSSILDLQRGGA
ncbi:MAG: AAA family ATPase, partial [Bacteroidales bacterium]|nr:AAA family ATPase [Bacteroidales bacterium]